MAGRGFALLGVRDYGCEIMPKLFCNASPSCVNVFDCRIAIRRCVRHR